MDWLLLQNRIQVLQTEQRFLHTLGVQYTAANLAMCYGANIEKARLAGLLHDVAKQRMPLDFLKLCEQYQISVKEIEKKNPSLLHAKVGAALAKEQFQIQDAEILQAIVFHTTGRPNMSLLEKIIFLADFIEPNRKKYEGMDAIRKLAYQNIDCAIGLTLKMTLAYLEREEKEIDCATKETYDFYKKELPQERQ